MLDQDNIYLISLSIFMTSKKKNESRESNCKIQYISETQVFPGDGKSLL